MALYICIECHSFATQQLKDVHNYFPYIHLFMVLNRLLPRARFPAQCRRTLNPVLWPCSREGPSRVRLSTVQVVMEMQISAVRFDSAQPKVPVEKPH